MNAQTATHRDFTLAMYEGICRALRDAGYPSLSIGDYLARGAGDRPERFVLLRHDVENAPDHAVKMGAIERQHGLVATYFYRTKRRTLDPQAIARLAAMGHEIGYHYDTLGRARGDIDRALRLFAADLARLRKCAPIRVASMHGSPLLPWDNRRIWERASPAEFGLVGEVYRDIDYRTVSYFSDTGRTWHPTRYNVRDRALTPPEQTVRTTAELIELIASRRLPRLCLLIHPERWSATLLSWALRAVRDTAENLGKVMVAGIHTAWRRLSVGRRDSTRQGGGA